MPYYSIRTKSTTSPCLRWRRQVYLLLAHILGKLTAAPVDGSQGNRVPAPKSVQCQWGEGDPLIGAPLFVLPHLPVMGALYSTLPSLEGTHHQACLEWIDHRNIKGAVLAIGPEGDQNDHHCQAGGQLALSLASTACSLHSCLEDCVPDIVVPGYPFTPDAAGDCVVAQDVAHTPAPCHCTM